MDEKRKHNYLTDIIARGGRLYRIRKRFVGNHVKCEIIVKQGVYKIDVCEEPENGFIFIINNGEEKEPAVTNNYLNSANEFKIIINTNSTRFEMTTISTGNKMRE